MAWSSGRLPLQFGSDPAGLAAQTLQHTFELRGWGARSAAKMGECARKDLGGKGMRGDRVGRRGCGMCVCVCVTLVGWGGRWWGVCVTV